MIYRGPCFLAVVCFESIPPPQCVARSATQRKTEKETQLADGREGGGGGGGAKLYDGEKTWSPKNHSLLSGSVLIQCALKEFSAAC